MSATAAHPRQRRNSSGLVRDVEILDVLAQPDVVRAGGLGVTRIAELVGRDKTVISRTLITLADSGLLQRNPEDMTYRLGPRLYGLAARTAESALAYEARPYIRRLALQTGETTHLSVLRDGVVLTVVSELSTNPLRTFSWEGHSTAAGRTPSGRVLLSDWSESEVRTWYAAHGEDAPMPLPLGLDRETSPFPLRHDPPPTAVGASVESLLGELAAIRQRGFSVSDEELEIGVVAASAPVVDFRGRVVAAVNVSAPKQRIRGSLDALGMFVAKAAAPL